MSIVDATITTTCPHCNAIIIATLEKVSATRKTQNLSPGHQPDKDQPETKAPGIERTMKPKKEKRDKNPKPRVQKLPKTLSDTQTNGSLDPDTKVDTNQKPRVRVVR